jgi:hypothetical protein
MKIIFFIFTYLVLISTSLWANGTFSDGDCVKCGGEQGRQEVELSQMDIIIFCNSHKSGDIKYARAHGVNIFGSKEAYYKNYHRIQCPPFYPSPLYHSVEEQPYEDELIKELEYIGEILTDKERARLLNRPDKGRRKATILDMADISYRRTERVGPESAKKKYELIRQKLEEIGAKRSDELTPNHLALYE